MIFINSFSGFINVADPVPGGKTVNVNFTATGNNATSIGWNNNLYITHGYEVALALLDIAGAASGWTIKTNIELTGNYFVQSFPTTTNFKSDIFGKTWWGNEYLWLTITVEGLNPAKTYDFNVGYPLENPSTWIEIHTTVTGSAATTHDHGPTSGSPATPRPTTSFEDLFAGIVPNSSGVITVFIRSGLTGTSNVWFWNLGGLIIKEN